MVSLRDAIHRPRLIKQVFCADLKGRLVVRGPIILDSGGFKMMTQNKSLTVEELARIYDRTRADLCVSLDLPAFTKDRKRTRNRQYREARKILAHLVEHIDARKLVPLVHGITIEEVTDNCEAIGELLPQPMLIRVGGLVPLPRRSGRDSGDADGALASIASMVSNVRPHFPLALVHVLGAGSPQTVAPIIRCGADSTDSLAWRRAAGFGTIFLPGTSERFLQPRNRLRAKSWPTINAKDIELLPRCACPACAETNQVEERIAELAESYIARAEHDAFVILQEAKAGATLRSKTVAQGFTYINSSHNKD